MKDNPVIGTNLINDKTRRLAEWLKERERIEKELKDHFATCEHWTVVEICEEQNKDPEFPDVRKGICKFCGKVITNPPILLPAPGPGTAMTVGGPGE